MAIGTIALLAQAQGVGPVFIDTVKFAGDGAYPTGGTVDFEGSLRTRVGDNREVMSVEPGPCGLYVPVYDKENDKLKVFVRTTGVEVGNGVDLSGTFFVMTVTSK